MADTNCNRCGENEATVDLGYLKWCQPCTDSAVDDADKHYSPVNMLLDTITDAKIPRDMFRERLEEIIRAAVAEEQERCIHIIREAGKREVFAGGRNESHLRAIDAIRTRTRTDEGGSK